LSGETLDFYAAFRKNLSWKINENLTLRLLEIYLNIDEDSAKSCTNFVNLW
jgi:hypothetical protein